MRQLLLHPVDRTFGGVDVVRSYPRRSAYALVARGLVDASSCLTPLGVQVQAALKLRAKTHKVVGRK